jgi:recombination protein RecA
MAVAARLAQLESLLRDKKLDRTLSTTLPPLVQAPDRLVTSGIDAVDAALTGGVPRGQITELVGPASSGRTTTMCRLLASATAAGELVAVVDALDRFDPVSAAEQGVVLDRLLWIRSEGDQSVPRALKALNLVLSAGGFGLVVFDVGGVPARTLRQLPFTTWLRVQRVIEGSDTACVLLADVPVARSPGGLSIRCGGQPAPVSVPAVDRRLPASGDFHARVRANRYVSRPEVHVDRSSAPAPAGRWRGSRPEGRQFAGLPLEVDVVRAVPGQAAR